MDGSPGRRIAEAPYRSVRKSEVELAPLEPFELPENDRSSGGPQADPTRSREAPHPVASLGARGHGPAEPFPETNGGLWWKGRPFSQSLAACRWISTVIWTVING